MDDLVWPGIKKGKYRHSRSGKVYRVLGVGKHSETLEDLVIYQAAYKPNRVWARPFRMFFEEVEVDGKRVARFEYVGD